MVFGFLLTTTYDGASRLAQTNVCVCVTCQSGEKIIGLRWILGAYSNSNCKVRGGPIWQATDDRWQVTFNTHAQDKKIIKKIITSNINKSDRCQMTSDRWNLIRMCKKKIIKKLWHKKIIKIYDVKYKKLTGDRWLITEMTSEMTLEMTSEMTSDMTSEMTSSMTSLITKWLISSGGRRAQNRYKPTPCTCAQYHLVLL